VALFDAQLSHLAEHGLTARSAREDREQWDFVYQRRNLVRGDVRAREARRHRDQIGNWFTALVTQIHPVHVGPHALEDDEKTDARGIHPDVFDRQLAVLREQRSANQECGRRWIT